MVVHAAARCRSDEFEVHVEGERPAGGQLVGRVDGGSPGVVSADAHLGREQAQVVVARFGQVLVAARGLDRVGVPGSLAQNFIRQHDGSIDVESEPGKTDFRILLPLSPPETGDISPA